MTQKKLSMLPTKYESLTELIKLVSHTIDIERVCRQYQLVLPKTTTNKRLVEVHVWYNPQKDLLKKIELKIYGNVDEGTPNDIELKDILKKFGGQISHIEYEYTHLNSNVQKAIIHNTTKLNSKQQLSAYLKTKERMKEENPTLSTTLYTGDKNNWFTLTSPNGEAATIKFWEMCLGEKRQEGFLADYKMNKTNKYFQKYIEPTISPVGWDIYWYDKSDLLL
ncbi:MAG: hypothetical protein V1914_02700 [archaeon]